MAHSLCVNRPPLLRDADKCNAVKQCSASTNRFCKHEFCGHNAPTPLRSEDIGISARQGVVEVILKSGLFCSIGRNPTGPAMRVGEKSENQVARTGCQIQREPTTHNEDIFCRIIVFSGSCISICVPG